MNKICIKCGIEKSLSEFRQFKTKYKPGICYRTECKVCEKIYADLNKEKYRLKREQNKEEIKRKKDQFNFNFPWRKHIYSARNRCNNPNKDNYKHYGKKGIKCELSNKDGEYLWHRDNADLMDYPTLDRKDGNKNYNRENCQFLDKKVHDLKTQIENDCLPKKITQLDENNRVIKIWDSLSQISRSKEYFTLRLKKAIIENKLYKGFYWKYTKI